MIQYSKTDKEFIQILEIDYHQYFDETKKALLRSLPGNNAERLVQYLSKRHVNNTMFYIAVATTLRLIDPILDEFPIRPDMLETDQIGGVHHLPFRYPSLFPWVVWTHLDTYARSHQVSYDKSMLLDIIEPVGDTVVDERVLAAKFALAYALERTYGRQEVTIKTIDILLDEFYRSQVVTNSLFNLYHGGM